MTSYERWRFAAWIIIATIGGLYLAERFYQILLLFGDIIALYFMGWLVQFVIAPVVGWFCRRGTPRPLAVIYVYVCVAALVVGGAIVFIPAVASEVSAFTTRIPSYQMDLASWSAVARDFLAAHGVPRKEATNLVTTYQHQISDQLNRLNDQLTNHFTDLASLTTMSWIGRMVTVLQQAFQALLSTVIVLILAFYMSLDGNRVARRLESYLPVGLGRELEIIGDTINRSFGGFLRGQLILAAIYGFLTWLTMRWFHLDLALVVAVFAGVMMLVPFLGTFLAILPSVVIGAIEFPDKLSVLWLVLVLAVWQHVVLNLLAPKILSSSTGMHPLMVFLGILLGAKIGGLLGVLFGVPILGVALVVVDLAYARIVAHRVADSSIMPTLLTRAQQSRGAKVQRNR